VQGATRSGFAHSQLAVVLPIALGGDGLIWLFHLDNIGRLWAGKERRIGWPKGDTT